MTDRERALVAALEAISLNCASAAWARTVANDALRKHGEAEERPPMSDVGKMAFDIAVGVLRGEAPASDQPLSDGARGADCFVASIPPQAESPLLAAGLNWLECAETLKREDTPENRLLLAVFEGRLVNAIRAEAGPALGAAYVETGLDGTKTTFETSVELPPPGEGKRAPASDPVTPAAASEGRHHEGCLWRDENEDGFTTATDCPGLPVERGGAVGEVYVRRDTDGPIDGALWYNGRFDGVEDGEYLVYLGPKLAAPKGDSNV